MHVDELETPVPVVDMDIMKANITRLQAYLDQHKIANRPHIKTHKIPAIAQLQMEAGAVGITCQKVSEAEVMADAGFDDGSSSPTTSLARASSSGSWRWLPASRSVSRQIHRSWCAACRRQPGRQD